MTEIFLPGLVDPQAQATTARHGHSPEAAAAQAEAIFARLHALVDAPTDVCKLTMMITDRAHRQAVYAVLGRALPGVFPVSTGLIVKGLLDPHALFQLDAYAVTGGPHDRRRTYRSTDAPYGLHKQAFVMDFCKLVIAGPRVYLRGQTGGALSGGFRGLNDPAAQARQAVQNVIELLAEAGATPHDATRLVTYVTDRAHLAPVLAAVEPAFPHLASTELVVKGLAAPELLMEIDVHATLSTYGGLLRSLPTAPEPRKPYSRTP